jgi:hypothetical protein
VVASECLTAYDASLDDDEKREIILRVANRAAQAARLLDMHGLTLPADTDPVWGAALVPTPRDEA